MKFIEIFCHFVIQTLLIILSFLHFCWADSSFDISCSLERKYWTHDTYNLHFLHSCRRHNALQTFTKPFSFIFYFLGEHLRTWRRVQSLLFHRPLVLWRGCPELSGFTLRWDNPLLSLFFQMSDLEYSAIYCFTCEMSWLHVSKNLWLSKNVGQIRS